VALLPGVALHGSGSWVLGDHDVAHSLMLAEASGVGLILGGGVGIALTGAARGLIAPLIVPTVFGVGLLGASFLADVVHVSLPAQYRGTALAQRPGLESQLGYVFVHNPQFAFRHLVEHGVVVRPGPWSIGYRGRHGPDQRYTEWALDLGWQFWAPLRHASGRFDGSSLELAAGLHHQGYQDEGFATQSVELALVARIDSERLVPKLTGTFTEFEAGYVERTTDFGGAATQSDTLLIARTGFGVYLPGSARTGGEVMIDYDHRHDGLAAGLLYDGIGSGAAGHFSFSGHYFLAPEWGVQWLSQVGSAWVFGAAMLFRSAASGGVP
jgi:hypothetical protein